MVNLGFYSTPTVALNQGRVASQHRSGFDTPEIDDIDLSSLNVEDLCEQMHDDLYDGLAEETDEGTRILLDRGWLADKELDEAPVEGMRIVGIDFHDGILYRHLS